MAEVSRIQGPSGPPEPKKDKPITDDEKFKKMMRIEETDEKQKKKKREKAEEDELTEEAAQAVAPPLAKAAPSLFEVEPKLKPVSGLSGKAVPESTRPERPMAPSPFAPQAPFPEEEAPPAPAEGERTRSRSLEQRQPQPLAPSHERQEKTQEAGPEKKKQVEKKEKHAEKVEEKKAIFPKEVAAPKEEEVVPSLTSEEELEEEKIEEIGAIATPMAPAIEEKAAKEEEKEVAPVAPVFAEPLLAASVDFTSAVPLSTPPYALLPPAMLELFEKMVGVISIVIEEGITQYEFKLNAPPTSALYGMQIVIQEFSTAPKAFNVQLLGSQQALDMVNNSKNNFLAAFQSGNYNFRINRIDTGYITDEKLRPIVRRKVTSSSEKGDKEREQK